jgi:tetratricopeptide (TPR) repeat protein
MKEGRNREALKLLSRYWMKNLGNSEFLHKYGTAAYRCQEYHLAEEAFRIAVGLPNAHPVSYYSHGLALEMLGRIPEARQEFNKAVSLDPNFIAAKKHLIELSSTAAEEAPRGKVHKMGPIEDSDSPGISAAGAAPHPEPNLRRNPRQGGFENSGSSDISATRAEPRREAKLGPNSRQGAFLSSASNAAPRRPSNGGNRMSHDADESDDFKGMPGFNIPRNDREHKIWRDRYTKQERSIWWVQHWHKLPWFAKAGRILVGIAVAVFIMVAATTALRASDNSDAEHDRWCQYVKEVSGQVPFPCQ